MKNMFVCFSDRLLHETRTTKTNETKQ